MLEIVLTREDANSESALLVEWMVADREQVRRGEPVCVIETSKSTIEIEAPGDGTLCHRARVGDEVEIGASVAAVATSPEEIAEIDAAPKETPAARADRGRVTRKAAELAAAHGIDIDQFEKEGFVTAEDIEALIAARDAGESTGGGPLAGISLDGITLPSIFTLDDGSAGAVEQGFLDAIRADPEAFAALSSEEKCAAYREHGALVGEGVQFGSGAIVVAPRIVLEDGVSIGARGSIECGEVFAAGELTSFGNDLEVRCRRVFVGRGGYFSREVRIGGGGNRDPQALLVLGDLVYVGDEAFLNPGRPVVAGAEVFITMRSAIITHNIGHSVLEGFENRFAPVVVEDRAQIGVGTVVYAGCRIGAEAIVASNSYVVTDVRAGKLAIGVPAREAGNVRRALTPPRVWELAGTMIEEFREQLALNGHDTSRLEGGSERGFSMEVSDGTARVLLVERVDGSFSPSDFSGTTVVFTLGVEGSPPSDVVVFDLLARRIHGTDKGLVVESAREFCRKRGIRLAPGPWRYRGGLI